MQPCGGAGRLPDGLAGFVGCGVMGYCGVSGLRCGVEKYFSTRAVLARSFVPVVVVCRQF